MAVELEHGECDTEIGSAAANRLLDVVAVTEAVLEVCEDGGFEGVVTESEAGLRLEGIWRNDFEDIFGASDEMSALFEELVAPFAHRARDVAWHDEDLFALLESVTGGIQRAGACSGFGDDNGVGESRNDAIALEKLMAKCWHVTVV